MTDPRGVLPRPRDLRKNSARQHRQKFNVGLFQLILRPFRASIQNIFIHPSKKTGGGASPPEGGGPLPVDGPGGVPPGGGDGGTAEVLFFQVLRTGGGEPPPGEFFLGLWGGDVF